MLSNSERRWTGPVTVAPGGGWYGSKESKPLSVVYAEVLTTKEKFRNVIAEGFIDGLIIEIGALGVGTDADPRRGMELPPDQTQTDL